MVNLNEKICELQKEEDFVNQRKIVECINDNINDYRDYNDMLILVNYISNDCDLLDILIYLKINYQISEHETSSKFLSEYRDFVYNRVMPSSLVYVYFDGEGKFYSYEQFFDFVLDIMDISWCRDAIKNAIEEINI